MYHQHQRENILMNVTDTSQKPPDMIICFALQTVEKKNSTKIAKIRL